MNNTTQLREIIDPWGDYEKFYNNISAKEQDKFDKVSYFLMNYQLRDIPRKYIEI